MQQKHKNPENVASKPKRKLPVGASLLQCSSVCFARLCCVQVFNVQAP